jgi:hypothetical protein
MARLSRLELPSAATVTGAVNRRPSLVATPTMRFVRSSINGSITFARSYSLAPAATA